MPLYAPSVDTSAWRVEIVVFTVPSTQTTWNTIIGPNVSDIYAGHLESSASQNSEVGWDIFLGAGTWDFSMFHWKWSDRGIYTVSLDGTSVGTIDGYAAGTTPNQVSNITGVSVATGGKKRLLLQMLTKNASSSGYKGAIVALSLQRTA